MSLQLGRKLWATAEFLGVNIAQLVKNPSAIQEIPIQFLGQENPLEKGMATHPSILAWRISWTEEPGGLQSMGSPKGQTHN